MSSAFAPALIFSNWPVAASTAAWAAQELLGARAGLELVQPRLGAGDARLGLGDRGLQAPLLQAQQRLARGHLVPLRHEQLLHDAADRHAQRGLQRRHHHAISHDLAGRAHDLRGRGRRRAAGRRAAGAARRDDQPAEQCQEDPQRAGSTRGQPRPPGVIRACVCG